MLFMKKEVTIQSFITVGIGGFIGTLLRFYLSTLANGPLFPWGTLFINWTGSFCLAWLLTYSARKIDFPPIWKAGIGTGFIGSFTTFSAFSAEVIQMPHVSLQLIYVLSSVLGGLLLALLGIQLGKESTS
jgi:CrcB protein